MTIRGPYLTKSMSKSLGKKEYEISEIQDNRYMQAAHEIIDMFEGLLDKKGIDIPSKDREGRKINPDEGRIYGDEYYNLEDEITAFLGKHFKIKS